MIWADVEPRVNGVNKYIGSALAVEDSCLHLVGAKVGRLDAVEYRLLTPAKRYGSDSACIATKGRVVRCSKGKFYLWRFSVLIREVVGAWLH